MSRLRLQLQDFSTEIVDVGSGPVLLLLHSLGLDKDVWSGVLPWLRPRCRAIAYDLRGHETASPLPHSHDIAGHASDLAAILDHLRIDGAHVVGLSFGGAVAQQFASTFPARTQSLTLIATVAAGLPIFAERATAAQREGLAAAIPSTLERWFTKRSIESGAPWVRYARRQLETLDVATWVGCWTSFARFEAITQLLLYAMPVHVIAGSNDASTPPDSMRGIAEAIPGARFTVIGDAPHMAPLEFPKTVAAAITSLLDDEPGAGPWLSAASLVADPLSLARLAGASSTPTCAEIFLATEGDGAWIIAKGADRQEAVAARDGLLERIGADAFTVRNSLVARRIGAYGDLDRGAPYLLPIGMPAPPEELEELARWYREEHVKMLLRSPNWRFVERYQIEETSPGGWTRVMLHGVGSPKIFDDPDIRSAVTTPWRNRLAERPWFLAGDRRIFRRVVDASASFQTER